MVGIWYERLMQVGRQALGRRNDRGEEIHPRAGELRGQAVGENGAEQRAAERHGADELQAQASYFEQPRITFQSREAYS